MNKIVKPIAFDQKSKMRLREHGADWEVKADPRFLPLAEGITHKASQHVLLQSCATGHIRWWPVEFIND